MMQKAASLTLSILLLVFCGCAKNSENINLKVTAGKETVSSFCVDTAMSSSAANNKSIFKQGFSKTSSPIKYIKNNQTVTLNFGSNLPQKVIVEDSLLNSTGNYLYTDKETDKVSLSKKGGKFYFILKKHWASALSSIYKKDKTNFRGFKVTANLGNKASVYAFVIKTDGY